MFKIFVLIIVLYLVIGIILHVFMTKKSDLSFLQDIHENTGKSLGFISFTFGLIAVLFWLPATIKSIFGSKAKEFRRLKKENKALLMQSIHIVTKMVEESKNLGEDEEFEPNQEHMDELKRIEDRLKEIHKRVKVIRGEI